ncbi:redoxin family protein [Cyclobacterium xiamenense]|uniref:redoxin family protein n=1 Tax=Cyclobacterium xiamenense TaxID=1297121 RepID=UPI0035CE92BD
MVFFLWAFVAYGQKITNLELVDAFTGQRISTSKQGAAKTMVFVFTSMNCPFAKLYEDRILALHQKYGNEDLAFALVNPHAWMETENQAQMQQLHWARQAGIPFLMDPDQTFTRMCGAKKIPEAVVISSGPTGYSIVYQGAIDNNAQSAESVSVPYLNNAIQDILDRRRPGPAATRAVGCTIRPIH